MLSQSRHRRKWSSKLPTPQVELLVQYRTDRDIGRAGPVSGSRMVIAVSGEQGKYFDRKKAWARKRIFGPTELFFFHKKKMSLKVSAGVWELRRQLPPEMANRHIMNSHGLLLFVESTPLFLPHRPQQRARPQPRQQGTIFSPPSLPASFFSPLSYHSPEPSWLNQ